MFISVKIKVYFRFHTSYSNFDPAVFRKYLDRSLHLLLQWMRRLTLRFSILLLFLMTEPSHSQLQIFLLFFMTSSGPLQKIQATVWKLKQDLSWKMLIQLRHPLWLKWYPHLQTSIRLPPTRPEPGELQKTQATAWNVTMDLIRRIEINLHHLNLLESQVDRIWWGI